jgi:hypothetical protein
MEYRVDMDFFGSCDGLSPITLPFPPVSVLVPQSPANKNMMRARFSQRFARPTNSSIPLTWRIMYVIKEII